VPLILDGLVGGPNSYPTHVASRLNFRVMKPTTASVDTQESPREPIHMRFSAYPRWRPGLRERMAPWPESLVRQLVAPVQAASLLRPSTPTAVWQLFTSAGFSQRRDLHKIATCIPSCRYPCSWIRRDRHYRKAGGSYRTVGGSTPSYLACDPCRSSDRTRDRLSDSWWGCQI